MRLHRPAGVVMVSGASGLGVGRGLGLDVSGPPAARGESATPPLRIFALGAVSVYVGQRLLTPPDWTFAKPRELLLYLLTNPASTKQQIGLDLWPAASAVQLR